jgi:hypothetical protein
MGTTVPLEWRFELESSAALTIDEFGDRLDAPNVDGQFAAYSEGGRQADLDEVIDAAEPIGYYANYAIYRMRPEFGSTELFSMLHFFKSPYLRPNEETGAPQVVDPAEVPGNRSAPKQPLPLPERPRRIALHSHTVDVVHGGGGTDAPAQESPLILVRGDGKVGSSVSAGAGPVIGARDDGWLRPSPVAG